MIKVGIADYGMSVWEGGLYDFEERCRQFQQIGYEGIEVICPITESDALLKAAQIHRLGMDFTTCQAPSIENTIQWTVALGKDYIWVRVWSGEFDAFCRQVNCLVETCKKWKVKVALHNHMGTCVETQAQLLEFLKRCPDCHLILDTAHLAAAAGGDPIYIVENYFDRLADIHLKDWISTNPQEESWPNRGYFCGLGKGNISLRNDLIVKMLIEKGYDKWVHVEHDTHLQNPLVDLKESREFLKQCGI